MDQRLIVTMGFVPHLIGAGLLAVAYSLVSVEFTDGQLEFLLVVGYAFPLAAMGLIWLKNYVYGAPLLVASTLAACWFSIYFFFVNDNPANVAAVTGDGSTRYLLATVAVVLGALVAALVGTWVWYRESSGFRSRVDGIIRPPDSRD